MICGVMMKNLVLKDSFQAYQLTEDCDWTEFAHECDGTINHERGEIHTAYFTVQLNDWIVIVPEEYFGTRCIMVYDDEIADRFEEVEMRHEVNFTDSEFTIKHPLSCRPNLFECDFNYSCETAEGIPNGRWFVTKDENNKLILGDRVEV